MLNKEGFNAWADEYDRSTARSAAGTVTFIQSLLPLLREGGVIYIGNVAFDTRASWRRAGRSPETAGTRTRSILSMTS